LKPIYRHRPSSNLRSHCVVVHLVVA